MMRMLSAGVVALLGVALVNAKLYRNTTTYNHTCWLDKPVLSCSKEALNLAHLDSCCTETFGGLVAQTQFWDTHTGLEDKGQKLPDKHWTIHGLWPDFCNGSFTQYCDLKRQYDPIPSPPTQNGKENGTRVEPYKGPSIDTFIQDWGRTDLLEFMDTFWISQGSPNKDFWAHEFSKHGTCYSTFDIPCYGPKYREHEEVIDFFDTALSYYRKLPTYDWLAAAGIKPSNCTRYSLSNITSALEKRFGAKPYIGCSGPSFKDIEEGKHTNDTGNTVLSEVWYLNHVYGRVQDGRTKPVDSPTDTRCATSEHAILYPERAPSSLREVPKKYQHVFETK